MPGFGNTLRAAATAFLTVPLGAILAKVLGEIVPMFNANSDDMLVVAFNTISQNAVAFGVLSAIVMVLAQAIVTEPRRVR